MHDFKKTLPFCYLEKFGLLGIMKIWIVGDYMEKFITTQDGSRIHYVTQGHGQVLVFLHGNNGSLEYFSKQIAYFSKNYFVLAMDARDQGKSDNKSNTLTFWQIARDLKEIFSKENIQSATLIGFSDGANLALAFSLLFPKVVDKLVLNAGNLVPLGLNPLGHLLTQLQVLGNKILSFFFHYFKKRQRVYSLMTQPLKITWKDLKKITAPSLVLVGQYDLISLKHSEKIATTLPQGRLLVLPKTFHGFARQKPQLFDTIIENYLKE